MQVLAFIQARMSRAGWVPRDRKIMTRQGVTERATYRLVRALQCQGALSSARHHCRIGLSLEDVPSASLPLIGPVVVVAPIFTVEHLHRTPKIHRLQEERSSLFILRLKGNRIVDPQIDGGDGRIVRAQPWVEPGDVGGAGIDMEVGSWCFRPHRPAWTRGPASAGDIICMNRCDNELSKTPRET